jgi:hypothetical protein
MNVLAYVEAILRGPKGATRRCRWMHRLEYRQELLVPVEVPELLASCPGLELVTLTIRVVSPRAWGVFVSAPGQTVSLVAPSVSLGGPALPKTGDVLVAFAPQVGWFEVTL